MSSKRNHSGVKSVVVVGVDVGAAVEEEERRFKMTFISSTT